MVAIEPISFIKQQISSNKNGSGNQSPSLKTADQLMVYTKSPNISGIDVVLLMQKPSFVELSLLTLTLMGLIIDRHTIQKTRFCKLDDSS